MRSNTWIWIVVAIVVIGGLFWWMSNKNAATNTNLNVTGSAASTTNTTGTTNTATNTSATVGASSTVTVNTPTSAAVTYNGSTYTPNTVTIKKGGTVTFTSTNGSMWVAVDEHPTHTEYDGTSRSTHCAAGYSGAKPFDQCVAGTSYSFTFNKTGSFQYHNHLKASATGYVKVVE